MVFLRKSAIYVLFLSLFSTTLLAQQGFNKTPEGLTYKFHIQNKSAAKPKLGDMMQLHLIYNINGDSVFFDSKVNPAAPQMELKEPSYPGDLNAALAMMAVGDSATFIIDASSFFLKTVKVQDIPAPFKAEDNIHFDIVLEGIQSREEYIAEQQKLYQQREAQKEGARASEKLKIAEYIQANQLNVKELDGGVKIVHLVEGSGVQAEKGKTVKVHYTGKFFDGKVFDSSYDRGQPISVRLGANQVIKGWETALPELKVGGKALIIIPFDMGYGERPAGSIPPFSSLLFEVELMEVAE